MQVYLIKNKDGIGYYLKDLTDLWAIFSEEEPETYTITNQDMTEEDFNNLPEFEGF